MYDILVYLFENCQQAELADDRERVARKLSAPGFEDADEPALGRGFVQRGAWPPAELSRFACARARARVATPPAAAVEPHSPLQLSSAAFRAAWARNSSLQRNRRWQPTSRARWAASRARAITSRASATCCRPRSATCLSSWCPRNTTSNAASGRSSTFRSSRRASLLRRSRKASRA